MLTDWSADSATSADSAGSDSVWVGSAVFSAGVLRSCLFVAVRAAVRWEEQDQEEQELVREHWREVHLELEQLGLEQLVEHKRWEQVAWEEMQVRWEPEHSMSVDWEVLAELAG